MKRLALLPILLSLVFSGTAFADDKYPEKAFTWSLALQNERTGGYLPFAAPVRFAGGERFRLILNTEADCYLYVLAEVSAARDLAVLHSGPLKRGITWFSPVMAMSSMGGRESLYVVTSREEQATLAERINNFSGNGNTLHRRLLMNEVFRLRNEASQFKANPERPVLIKGSSTRDMYGSNEGMEFFGMATYVKTISFEH
jgi:hypothetical protein